MIKFGDLCTRTFQKCSERSSFSILRTCAQLPSKLPSTRPGSGPVNRTATLIFEVRTFSTSRIIPNSAVEGEAQDKAQAFRSERNRPVPLSAVAGIGAIERRPQASRTKCQVTKKTL